MTLSQHFYGLKQHFLFQELITYGRGGGSGRSKGERTLLVKTAQERAGEALLSLAVS